MDNSKICEKLHHAEALKSTKVILGTPVFIKSHTKNNRINYSNTHHESKTGKFRDLCLKCAYRFLASKGFQQEAKYFRSSKEHIQGYSLPSFKKARLIKFFTDNCLLEEFINSCWKCALSEDGRKKIEYYNQIMNKYLSEAEVDECFEQSDETKFVFEEDLKKFLLKNLSLIETGLKVYRNGDISGIEFRVDDDNKRIDILAVDKDSNPVVIELKLSKGYERVIGQCLYYRNKLKKTLGVDKVRIIIVAGKISGKLIIAVSEIPNVELFSYKLFFKLDKVLID